MADELGSRVATGYGVDSALLDLLPLVSALFVRTRRGFSEEMVEDVHM